MLCCQSFCSIEQCYLVVMQDCEKNEIKCVDTAVHCFLRKVLLKICNTHWKGLVLESSLIKFQA